MISVPLKRANQEAGSATPYNGQAVRVHRVRDRAQDLGGEGQWRH